MPFLSRRSVDPQILTPPSRNGGLPLNPFDNPHALRTRARSEASILRRVSSLFNVRRRSSPKLWSFPEASTSTVGVEYRCTFPRSMLPPRMSNDSNPQPSLEIRRPSGLGRRASLLGSECSSGSESFGYVIQEEGEDGVVPVGFATLPNLFSGESHSERSPPHPSKRCLSSVVLPDPILRLVLEFLPRNDLAVVALASHGLCAAARYALYHSLDVRTMSELSLERLYNVLACKRELAALVISFHCDSWPSWELVSPDASLSSTPSHDVRQALQNMCNLKSLTLPSFASILSLTPSLTFCLTHLTVLDKRFTQSQLVGLRSWLTTQLSLESLSFPHAVEYGNADSPLADEWAPVADASQTSSHDPSTTLLPGLKSLRASTEILSMLCLPKTNSIQHLTLDVRGTLYTGLRPSSVIRSLCGVREMHIVFAAEVDRRTVEKFLGVTGNMLTGVENANAMKSLEVEVLWTDDDAAETLYGIVTSIISRFRGLETLKLTSPFRSIQADIPVPPSLSQLRRPSLPPSPPGSTCSFDFPSMYAATRRGSVIRKEFLACGIEKGYAKMWTENCPSLSDIQFDFSCSTTNADIELCGVWFRRKIPLSLPSMT